MYKLMRRYDVPMIILLYLSVLLSQAIYFKSLNMRLDNLENIVAVTKDICEVVK